MQQINSAALIGVAIVVAATGPFPTGAVAGIPEQVESLLRDPDRGWSAIWPGFDPSAVPVALFDGESTRLYRHPAPPPEFEATGSLHGRPLFSMAGRHPAVTANASAVIGETRTATLLLDADDRDERLRRILLHESFHVYQRRAHPHWSANEADLFLYPFDDENVLAEARLEIIALENAAAQADDEGGTFNPGPGNGDRSRAAWAKAALEARHRRHALLDRAAIEYERKTEWNEGTATYVEQTGTAWERFDSLLDRQYPPEDVRQRGYVSGALLCRALDFLRPGWRDTLEKNDTIPLDVLLADAIPAGTVAAPLPVDSVLAASRNEIALLTVRNQERLREMTGRPGYQVRIQSLEEPLSSEGFDPLNIAVLEPGVVLHSRFVRLGNGRGSVEVFDWESLTVASGESHPLFAGVREISITGLGAPAVVKKEGGAIRIETAPVRLNFEGATFTTLDSVTVITLPGGP
ncbi:MAG: hypothetical protein HKN20_09470 [Gemmatimonadetes bacterium]|nr:hypothetical protein [Gemmatimonadota bacterium]